MNFTPDLREFYGGMYKALPGLFGVDLDDLLQRQDAWHPPVAAWRTLFKTVLRSAVSPTTPFEKLFEGALAVPPEASALYERYGGRAREVEARACELHHEMLWYLYGQIYGRSDKVVTSEDLREAGFDDSPEPEFDPWGEIRWGCEAGSTEWRRKIEGA